MRAATPADRGLAGSIHQIPVALHAFRLLENRLHLGPLPGQVLERPASLNKMPGHCKAAQTAVQVIVAIGEASPAWLYNVHHMGRPLLTPLDRLLEVADAGLRASFARPDSRRPTPGTPQTGVPEDNRRRHVAGLMRVNHAGEIAAQGLYYGQALTAKDAWDPRGTPARRRAKKALTLPVWPRPARRTGFTAEPARPVVVCRPSRSARLRDSAAIARASDSGGKPEPVRGPSRLASRATAAGRRRSRAIIEQIGPTKPARRRGLAAGGAPPAGARTALMRITARVMTGTAYWI